MKETDKAESIKNGIQSLASNDCFQDILDLVDCLLISHSVARSFLNEKNKSSPSQISSEATLIPLGMLIKICQPIINLCNIICLLDCNIKTIFFHLVVKQETESLKCAVEILLELYYEKSTIGEDHEKTERKLLSVLADVLSYFLSITSF